MPAQQTKNAPASGGGAQQPQSPTIMQRVQAMPFLVKFGAGAVLVALFYFLGVDPLLARMSKDKVSAERNEVALVEFARSGGAFKQAEDTVSLGQRHFGVVALPGDPQSRPSAFNQAVDAVLSKHSVADVTSSSRTTPMSASPLTKFLGAEKKAERVMKELSFQCTPEQFHAVLADLERTPEVSVISRLQVRQGDERQRADRLVKVTMSLETWTVSKKEAAK